MTKFDTKPAFKDALHFVKVEGLKKIISEVFELEWDKIISPYRQRRYSLARQFFAHYGRLRCDLTCTEIAKHLQRDHTTILTGWRSLQDQIDSKETEVARYNELIKSKISS
jgi:chromosomal replication initiation ATPase DnaA